LAAPVFGWLSSFGLFARYNATLVVALFLCALSISGAIFLIRESGRVLSPG